MSVHSCARLPSCLARDKASRKSLICPTGQGVFSSTTEGDKGSMRPVWLFGLLVVFAFPSSSASDLVGRATVIDGDTLEIHATRVRLWESTHPSQTSFVEMIQHNIGAVKDLPASLTSSLRAIRLRNATTISMTPPYCWWQSRRRIVSGVFRPIVNIVSWELPCYWFDSWPSGENPRALGWSEITPD